VGGLHIIASSRGGLVRTDNYLFAFGEGFSHMIGHHFDTLECFLAAKVECKKAVAIVQKVASDVNLHEDVDKRSRTKCVLYTEGPYKGKSAEDLYYKEGENLIRDFRRLARDRARKASLR
jgi:hypothetical protein